jgi:hypothetical protein
MNKTFVYAIIIVIIGYLIKNINIELLSVFKIPENMYGWLAISLLGPIVNTILNKSTWMSIIKNYLFYSYTYSTLNHGGDAIDWVNIYIKNNMVYASGFKLKITLNRSSYWWNDDCDSICDPQIVNKPLGFVLFKYKNKYFVAYIEENIQLKLIYSTITIWSFTKIDWINFTKDMNNYYIETLAEKGKMKYYQVGSSAKPQEDVMKINKDLSIDICFGNKAKTRAWNLVNDFLTPEKKHLYKNLGQSYKTSFLIHGPPGTGKSDFVFKLASHTWKTHQKPVYILNPRGMDDSDLEEVIKNITTGYVLVDEWDLVLAPVSENDFKDDIEQKNLPKRETYPSIKCWLDILDQAKGEIIFWFTTNNYEKLASINRGALIRDGRIDHRIEFNTMDANESRKALTYFYPNQSEIIDSIPNENIEGLTIANIIKHLKCEYPIEKLVKSTSS